MDKLRELSVIRQTRLDNLAGILDRVYLELNKKKCKNCHNCCCSSCGPALGYFDGRWNADVPVEFLKNKYGYTKESGFLTITGCSLPRQLRSHACLGYACKKFSELVEKKASLVFSSEIKYAGIITKFPASRILAMHGIRDYIDRTIELIQKIRGW